ncbi:HNH endonuclease [Salinirubellus salinus]|uniref:HNH endonuclease n=1 Tax=Salinirubellus salinus TaxID=1364945 RepID=A0A9E7R6M1_9EURY|nr:HNH endonuclease [Salinirubellus salinus]UWM56527.1 HNH endonuclease [Salinirubellus salinus]
MTHPCPSCDRTFETLAGMRQHHTKVHDEPLANCTCATCEMPFYDPDSARVYCADCYDTGGVADWNRGNTETECIECGATFLYYPSEKSGLYCPTCVADPSVTCRPRRRDESGKRTVDCTFCGAKLAVYRSKAEGQQRVYCDRECYDNWLVEDHKRRHSSKVAPSEYYTTGWIAARRAALERDDHTCQRCGIAAEDAEQPLEVHHITPVRTFEYPVDAHLLDNLVTLCRPCHYVVENCGDDELFSNTD